MLNSKNNLIINSSPDAYTSVELTPEMFKPIKRDGAEAEKITRPVLTYFQDAIMRFRKNKVGMACLIIILFIALVGIVGPWFFPADVNGISYENQQNPNAITQDPTLGAKSVVIADDFVPPDQLKKADYNLTAPMLTSEKLVPPSKVNLSGLPTTSGITLEWEPIEGVSGYKVYRSLLTEDIPANSEQLAADLTVRSMSLSTIDDPSIYSYTDAAGVDSSEKYVYTVTSYLKNPETSEETESTLAGTLIVEPISSIKLSDALNIDKDVKPGDTIRGRMYLFGTDSLGRDSFARMIQGTRVDFTLALTIPIICLIIGIAYGAISGLSGGKVDLIMMRIIEVLSTLPSMLFMIILQVVLGKGFVSLFISMILFSWMGSARVIRGEVLRLREIEFVHASKLLGAPIGRIIKKHLAPNLIAYILVDWSGRIPGVIVSEAFLSQLGLGLEQPTASWGGILQDVGARVQAYPLQFFLPSLVLGITLLAFYMLGDALTEALDPKLRGRD